MSTRVSIYWDSDWHDADVLGIATSGVFHDVTVVIPEEKWPMVVNATIATTGPIVNRENYVDATIALTDMTTEASIVTLTGQMRGRGNSTWNQPKKPYKVKLAAPKREVFGMAESRDWALLANYIDQSNARTAIAMEIWRRATGTWAPRSFFVNATLNGTPIGLYQFSETCDVQVGRVDIREMKAGNTSGLALTGPYFLECDSYAKSDNFTRDAGFLTSEGTPIVYDVPDVVGVPAQEAYIQDWIEDFEQTLIGGGDDWMDQADVASWVDWYIMQEWSLNNDSAWTTSCKFIKTQDTEEEEGKIVLFPIWDFDLSLSNAWDISPANTYQGWRTRLETTPDLSWPNWLYHAWQSEAFRDAVRDRWDTAWKPVLDNIAGFADEVFDAIGPSVTADRAIWRSGGALPGVHTRNTIKTWIANRTSWVNTNL